MTPFREGPPIRLATDADLACVHAWLHDEHRQQVEGNFLCNWNIIASHQAEGLVLVYVDPSSQEPIGFLAGGLTRDGIPQVRCPFRKRGVGRALAEYAMTVAIAERQGILVIQCAPETSIPFWTRMGFTPLGDSYAYRLLDIRHQLPSVAEGVEVAIHFFSERRKWRADVLAITSHYPPAVQTSDEYIQLGERVQFPACLEPDSRDPVVEIIVQGRQLYLDKAKYAAAKKLGVERCPEGFWIDGIDTR